MPLLYQRPGQAWCLLDGRSGLGGITEDEMGGLGAGLQSTIWRNFQTKEAHGMLWSHSCFREITCVS